jgi:hypothetical protein
MWNPRELPPEYYKSEVERLQRENADLKASAKTSLGFWSKYVFWKWLFAMIVFVGMLLLAARAAGPRGVELAAVVGLLVLPLTAIWKWKGSLKE